MATVTIRPPRMAQYQIDAIFHDERYGVVEATTKAGKTFACIWWLIGQAVRNGGAGREFWWVAPIYPQARIAYRRVRDLLTAKDPNRTYWQANETENTITLGNGSVLRFLGSDKPDSLYGEDVWAAVIDEASRCKEEAWHAVRSTLTATRGPIRIIGNVRGRRNWAYRLARRAEAGAEGMRYAKITAMDAVRAGILDRAEIDDARAALPDSVFRELYLAEASDDGGNPFGLASIEACVRPQLALGPVAAWGWDLAKSIDWCVGIGLNAAGAVCEFHRFQRSWDDTEREIVRLTGRTTPGLVDSTGVGDPIVERLAKRTRLEGIKYTSQSKQQLMEGLAVAIQHREVTFPDGPIRHELDAFEYEYTRTGVRYSAPDGMHDDCVCALAQAVRAFVAMPRAFVPSEADLVGVEIADDWRAEVAW